MQIVIIDYGAGNTANVKNALEKLGARPIVSPSVREIKNADAIILPGVGAFGAAMKRLSKKSQIITNAINSGKPFLGICLGMQLLLDKSDESEGVNGLGIIRGKVKKFKVKLPVPQIGWNKVENLRGPLFEGIDDFYAYFVHSYYCKPKDKRVIAATTKYAKSFASAFYKKNIFATQFHPEKSGKVGLKILKNFIREVKK